MSLGSDPSFLDRDTKWRLVVILSPRLPYFRGISPWYT